MRYFFENCELRPESHELLIDGRHVDVEPQVFDMLMFFAQHPQELITRDLLVEAIWDGRIVSDSAISARISAARSAIGDNGTEQKLIKTIARRGFRFVANVTTVETNGDTSTKCGDAHPANEQELTQRVRFCHSADGTRIAFATIGAGYPVIRAAHWLTHLEHDWQSPLWHPFLQALSERFQLIRYDQRGNGLSDWEVSDFSLERCVEDLEAVAAAAGVPDRFALYGTSQGAPIAIAYAAKHPDRVSRLILHGGYVKGRLIRGTSDERENGQAWLTLIRHGWGKPGPFQQAFASMYIPEGSRDQIACLTDLQRKTTSPENAAKLRRAVDAFDVSDLLCQIEVPTLVLHARGDGVQPLDQGIQLAAGIKDADFLMLESANHAVLEGEPAWATFFAEIERFVC
ncbi:alpha/beta fold hydrolase [Roseibium aggregatum]|uniref:Alpha/beta hydrolase n=1 Tax=Roseibium aggregatum TaxID=187304 RepID=A0A926S3G9_9HYPH|nr:alpha/beta fold hydrolase [Roseibium aggregatum]MBD1545318.1 alpha/beta hydrolase [Roseibium aggregatum]